MESLDLVMGPAKGVIAFAFLFSLVLELFPAVGLAVGRVGATDGEDLAEWLLCM